MCLFSNVRYRRIQCFLQISVEEQPIEPVHGHPMYSPLRLDLADVLVIPDHIGARTFHVGLLGYLGPARHLGPLQKLGNAEHGLPSRTFGGRLGAGDSEPGGGEGASCPAVLDIGEMPVDDIRGRVAVELVADVDECLDGGYVDVVDGRAVEDDGLESGPLVGVVEETLGFAGTGVVPWAILYFKSDIEF